MIKQENLISTVLKLEMEITLKIFTRPRMEAFMTGNMKNPFQKFSIIDFSSVPVKCFPGVVFQGCTTSSLGYNPTMSRKELVSTAQK